MSDQGGDPACWLHEVCDTCGALVDDIDRHECEPAHDLPLPASESERE